MTRLAYTVVEHKGKQVAVSTINRQSSALLAYDSWYAETLVFEMTPHNTHGKILAQGEACEDSLRTHDKYVKLFQETGKFEEDDNE